MRPSSDMHVHGMTKRRCKPCLSRQSSHVAVRPPVAVGLQYVPSRHVGLEWLLTVYVAPMCGAYILTAAFVFRAIVAANTDLAARYIWSNALPEGPRPAPSLGTPSPAP